MFNLFLGQHKKTYSLWRLSHVMYQRVLKFLLFFISRLYKLVALLYCLDMHPFLAATFVMLIAKYCAREYYIDTCRQIIEGFGSRWMRLTTTVFGKCVGTCTRSALHYALLDGMIFIICTVPLPTTGLIYSTVLATFAVLIDRNYQSYFATFVYQLCSISL